MKTDFTHSKSSKCWQLGQWRYWPDSGQIKKGQKVVRLSNQLNQVLKLLIEFAPSVVKRQQFLDEV